MARISRLTDVQIADIVSQFDMGTFWNYNYIRGGQANTNYSIVTTKGEYVLTICDEKTEEEVHQRTILLDRLFDKGLPVPEIVPNIDGYSYIMFNNKPVIVKTFIEGQIVKHFNEKQTYQMGEVLAQIHTSAVPSSLPMKMPYDIKGFKEVYKHDNYFGKWVLDKVRFLKEHIPTNVPKGLIHGDFFWDNVLFHGEELSAVIDFEEACSFDLAYDLSMALIGTCVEKNSINEPLARSFIKGYQKVRKIQKIEKDHLNYYITYAATAAAYWRFRQYNIVLPNDRLKNHHEVLMEIADYYDGVYAKVFTDSYFAD